MRYFQDISPAERNHVEPGERGGGLRGSDFYLVEAKLARDLLHLPSTKYPAPARCLMFLVKLLHFYCLILISPYLPFLIKGRLCLMMRCLRVR